MRYNARPQAFSLIENNRKQETDRDSIENLHERFGNIFSIEKVYDMSDSKGDTGNDHRILYIIFAHCFEQKSSENDFFQKANAQHANDIQDRLGYTVVQFYSPPHIRGA